MNNSSSEAAPFDLEPTFSYSVATCYTVIPLVAIVGNLLVCYAILTNRELRDNPTNLLLLSLAISDLLTVTLVVPFDVEALFLHGQWKHWKALCITWLTVYLITVPSSVLTLLAISVDRSRSVPTFAFHDQEESGNNLPPCLGLLHCMVSSSHYWVVR